MTAPAEPLSPAVEHCMRQWAERLPCFDDENLAHEAERLETLPPSTVADLMRHAVDAELTARAGAR